VACLSGWPCDIAYRAEAVQHLITASDLARRPGQDGTSGWTIAAVIVAALAAVVVAWQAYEAHRATALSQDALRSSQAVAVDGARARIDAGAADVEVYVKAVRLVLPLDETERRWSLPADGDEVIFTQADVEVINHSAQRRAHFKASGDLIDQATRNLGNLGTEGYLPPGKTMHFRMDSRLTVQELVGNGDAHRASKPFPREAAASVTCRDDRDMGVVDTWQLRFATWLDRDPERPDYGRAQHGNKIEKRPLRERAYWISQLRQIPLPEPDYQPARRRRRLGRRNTG
jgi:hypothetical protein